MCAKHSILSCIVPSLKAFILACVAAHFCSALARKVNGTFLGENGVSSAVLVTVRRSRVGEGVLVQLRRSSYQSCDAFIFLLCFSSWYPRFPSIHLSRFCLIDWLIGCLPLVGTADWCNAFYEYMNIVTCVQGVMMFLQRLNGWTLLIVFRGGNVHECINVELMLLHTFVGWRTQ